MHLHENFVYFTPKLYEHLINQQTQTMRKTLFSGIAACLFATAATAAEQSPSVIWTVGQADRSASEFALAPDRFRDFLANDFGYEDKYFLVAYQK